MKKLFLFLLVAASLTGCASVQENSHYSEIANNNEFAYFFPSSASVHTFATIEEAKDFIYAAQVKLASTARKSPAKGLPAKLNESGVKGDKPIVVVNYLGAYATSGSVDLAKSKKSLENNLLDAISVSCVFLVFTEDKGIALSKFFLKDGYYYTANSQIKEYSFKNKTYKAEYPLGLTADDALKYLGTEEKTE